MFPEHRFRLFNHRKHLASAGMLCTLLIQAPQLLAADSSAELAKKLSNPIASLISVPMQGNYDQDLGPFNDGERYLLNVQPVIPFSISSDWNMISRTIIPLVKQDDMVPGSSQEGFGDVVQSLFFSPKAPTADGWIWGVGPVFLLRTASDKYLGSEKWGAGPTAVLLKQSNGWTFGALANHINSYSGDDDRSDVNATFLQPFLSFTTARFTTWSLNTESTYDWEAEKWNIPVNFTVAQLFKVGAHPMQLQLGVRRWLESPQHGAEGWGARLTYTLLFPK
ncbi:MAG: transporter [Pseudomonadales bacterium]